MKNLIKTVFLFFIVTGCTTVVDDTNKNCVSDCTTLTGRFVTVDNAPVSGVKIMLSYIKEGGEAGSYTRKIANAQSDQNGNFYNSFYIKDNELKTGGVQFFELEIDDSNIDVNKYIRINNFPGGTDTYEPSISITKRDTILDETFYIPKKAFITVNLNNFDPQNKGDSFSVFTLYPFGIKNKENPFLDSGYSTGFSNSNWFATKTDNKFKVFVAESEKNIVRIYKRKNGVESHEDFEITVPPNNTIELTYNF